MAIVEHITIIISMRNLFYIHSNITLLSSLAVCEKLNLKNIIFIFGRSFETKYIPIPDKIQLIKYNSGYLENTPTQGRFFSLKLIYNIFKLDRLILSVAKTGFKIFLPHTNNYLMQLFITHNACKEYNIIDEGLLSYNTPERLIKKTQKKYTDMNWFKKTVYYLSHFNRTIVFKPIQSSMGAIYLFNQSGFEKSGYSYSAIQYPLLNVDLWDISDAPIFIFDNVTDQSILDEPTFYSLFDLFFENLKDSKFYVKFHPAQHNKLEIIKRLEHEKFTFTLLPDDFPMEITFTLPQKLNVIGVWSSLLFYASCAGHHVKSYILQVCERSNSSKKWVHNHIPKVFYNNIELA